MRRWRYVCGYGQKPNSLTYAKAHFCVAVWCRDDAKGKDQMTAWDERKYGWWGEETSVDCRIEHYVCAIKVNMISRFRCFGRYFDKPKHLLIAIVAHVYPCNTYQNNQIEQYLVKLGSHSNLINVSFMSNIVLKSPFLREHLRWTLVCDGKLHKNKVLHKLM